MSIENLNASIKMYAFEHLNETRENLIEGEREMREFINGDKELSGIVISETTILYFLRANKFKVERAKKKIKSFYVHRLETSDWFHYRDPFLTTINELLEIGVFLPLLEKDEFNRQIVIIRIAAHNPKIYSQNDVMKVSLMVLDWLCFNDVSISVYGIRAIFDMKNVQLGHALQMTPTIIKRAVQSMESYPIRIQQLNFVNAHLGINIVLDIFKKFMSLKLKDRITVTRGNPKFIASDNLPIDLGGVNKSYCELAAYWKNKLEKNYKWFSENFTY